MSAVPTETLLSTAPPSSSWTDIPHTRYLEILAAGSFEQLRDQVQSIVDQLGFIGFKYFMVTGQRALGDIPDIFILSSYAQDYVDHYQSNHCYLHDPAAIHVRQHQYPIHWGRSSFTGARAKTMYQMARKYGLKSGASFPVSPPSICIAGFGFASDQEIEDARSDLLAAMPHGQLLATFTHQSVLRLLNVNNSALANEITDRERACLHLAVKGLRDSEIAAQLGISPRTVLFHLSNARNKLKADNRSQMIARAMALKVIGI